MLVKTGWGAECNFVGYLQLFLVLPCCVQPCIYWYVISQLAKEVNSQLGEVVSLV